MKDAVAYYILCRVWQYCLEESLWDAMDVVARVKSNLLAEGTISMDAFNTANECYRWSKQLDFSATFESEVRV